MPRLIEQNDVIKLRGGAENGSRLGRWNGLRRPWLYAQHKNLMAVFYKYLRTPAETKSKRCPPSNCMKEIRLLVTFLNQKSLSIAYYIEMSS